MAGPDQINGVNWDSIRFKLADRSGWPVYRTLEMADPLAFTEADTARVVRIGRAAGNRPGAMMHEDSVGMSLERRRGCRNASPEEQLLLPAPAPLPTGDSAVVNSGRFPTEEEDKNDAAA